MSDTTNVPTSFFVIDVESIGLHGQGYAVAGGIYGLDGSRSDEFCFSFPSRIAIGDQSDRDWVRSNVPEIAETHELPWEMYEDFWELWLAAKAKGAVMAADCLWPVEARFVNAVVDEKPEERKWEGPYPFVEISSYLAAAGMDPLGTYDRLEDELPKHDPLGDVRQSARLLVQAVNKIEADARPEKLLHHVP